MREETSFFKLNQPIVEIPDIEEAEYTFFPATASHLAIDTIQIVEDLNPQTTGAAQLMSISSPVFSRNSTLQSCGSLTMTSLGMNWGK